MRVRRDRSMSAGFEAMYGVPMRFPLRRSADGRYFEDQDGKPLVLRPTPVHDEYVWEHGPTISLEEIKRRRFSARPIHKEYVDRLHLVFEFKWGENRDIDRMRVSRQGIDALHTTDVFDIEGISILRASGILGYFRGAIVHLDEHLPAWGIDATLQDGCRIQVEDLRDVRPSIKLPPLTEDCPCGIRRAVCEYHK